MRIRFVLRFWGWFSLTLLPVSLTAQNLNHNFVVQDLPLQEALQKLVDQTRIELAYKPELVKGKRAFCLIRNAQPEQILKCVLAETGLDYYRLSSGTYVLTAAAYEEAVFGSVSGRVTDGETGEPLPYASVLLADAGMGVQTNPEGLFTIPRVRPGDYDLLITFVGYEPNRQALKVRAHAQLKALVQLSPQPVSVKPVIIEGLQGTHPPDATWTAGDLTQTPNLGGNALSQSLATLYGLRKDHVTADLHLQGGDTGEHQILLDRVPLYLPMPIAGLMSAMSPYALSRIQVHRAGFGAAQGSYLSGVLQAEHAISATETPEWTAQLDPMAFNFRAGMGFSPQKSNWQGGGMVAFRHSLAPLYQTSVVERMLNEWSAPDLLPINSLWYSETGTTGDQANVSSSSENLPQTHPVLGFSDFHAAAKMRFNTIHQFSASFYRGSQTIQSQDQLYADSKLVEESLSLDLNTPAKLAAAAGSLNGERFGWKNTAFQIRYSTLLSAHLLLDAQARRSAYRFDHQYISSRVETQFTGSSDNPELTRMWFSPSKDGNAIMEQSADATMDWLPVTHHRLSLNAGLSQLETDLRYLGLPIEYNSQLFRAYGYAEHEWNWGFESRLTSGLRVTHLPGSGQTWLEPRLALRWTASPAFSFQTSAGIYRQYLSQIDVSTFSSSSYLPYVRIWLPYHQRSATPAFTPATGSDTAEILPIPARAIHWSAEALWQPTSSWTVRADGYAKRLTHLPMLDWSQLSTLLNGTQTKTEDLTIMTEGSGRVWGSGFSAKHKRESLTLEARYDYTWARYTDPKRFAGKAQPPSWVQPHVVEAKLFWQPTTSWTLVAKWQGIWGRAWGFRRVYYDYLSLGEYAQRPGYDLTNPSDDVLSPHSSLDLAASWQKKLGKTGLQIRGDVLNATNRKNEMDWQLTYNSSTMQYEKKPRYLMPIVPSLSVRLSW